MTRRALVAGLLVATVLAGCGAEGRRPELRVAAATSLKSAITEYAATFGQAGIRLSFASSDELTAQAKAGAPIDILLVADPTLLARAGTIEADTIFAANRLVIGVPAGSPGIRSLSDLGKPGTRIAAGSRRSPIGRYARRFIARLEPYERVAIRRNIRTEEPDAAGIVGKLSAGAVDAGFVYASDVTTSEGRLEAIALPAQLEPGVEFAAAVLARTAHREEALAFVTGLRTGPGAAALRRAGFQVP